MNLIAEKMIEKKIQMNELARNSAVSSRTIQKIINGDIKNPGVYTIKKIAKALGYKSDDIYN